MSFGRSTPPGSGGGGGSRLVGSHWLKEEIKLVLINLTIVPSLITRQDTLILGKEQPDDYRPVEGPPPPRQAAHTLIFFLSLRLRLTSAPSKVY